MCEDLYCIVRDFQTLIGGLLAVLAALGTAITIWKSSNLPIVESRKEKLDIKKRRKDYACFILSRDLRLLERRARAAAGTIRNVIGANATVNDGTREKTTLAYSKIIDDWEFMSLFGTRTLDDLLTLQTQVDDHNFDMKRAGGAFGADNFRQQILTRISRIQSTASSLGSSIFNERNNSMSHE